MTAPTPAANPRLFGHDGALARVAESWASGRMHHAWMIAGPEGAGKATLAFHIAHFVLSGGRNPMGQLDLAHPSSRLIVSGAHPDLKVIGRPVDEKSGAVKDVIPVESARDLIAFFRMTAVQEGWRVAILDEAHAFNRNGQNAILKILEEPPPRSLLLLTVTTPGALLATIRSRCCVLNLLPLAPDPFARALAHLGLDPAGEGETALLGALAGGSVGLAVRLQEEGLAPVCAPLFDHLAGLPGASWPEAHKLAETLAKLEGTGFRTVMGLALEALRRGVVRASGKAVAGDFPRIPALESLPVDRALQVWETARDIVAQTEGAALDRKLGFLRFVGAVREGLGAARAA